MVEFGMAIASVIIVVMLLLPIRMAVVSSVAAPIAILITFGLMNMIGVELHQVSLAALIIVLGMVVDNAIVVVDNYIEKLDEGLTHGQVHGKRLHSSPYQYSRLLWRLFLPLHL
jgi:multidrug efflux pump subunit AcrB